MNNYYTPEKDYNLIKFSKEQKDIIKRIKEYSFRNCRTEILQSYITTTLQNFDNCFAFFRTEIMKKNNEKKN